jgi:hypothetical protein
VGKWERNAAFGGLSAQTRGKGVEQAPRATSKTRRKDASAEQPKNKRRCWISVKSAMKEDWLKSHPRQRLVDSHIKNLPSVLEPAFFL